MQTTITISNATNERIIRVFDQEPSSNAMSSFEVRACAVLNPAEDDTEWSKKIEISGLCRPYYDALITDATNATNQRTDISLKAKSVILCSQAVLAAVNAGAFSYLPASWTWSINV